MATITIYCDGIGCEAKIEDRQMFCPACELQARWFGAVCPGCVTSFPACDLGVAIGHYEPPPNISDAGLDIINAGRCPYRINGSFKLVVSEKTTITAINLSELATNESGKAVCNAIEKRAVR